MIPDVYLWNSGGIPPEYCFKIPAFFLEGRLTIAFNNNMSADLKFSKAQISKIIQSGGYLGSLLSKLAGPLMKVLISLAKDVLAPLRITAAA